MENIKHIVYLMLENRSLDQLLGWLYDNDREKPAHFIPPTKTGPYQGLSTGKYYNPDCNGTAHGRPAGARPHGTRTTAR